MSPNTELILRGILSAVLLALLGWGVFLFDCPLLILAGIALPGPALLLASLSGAVRVLVSAVLDRTLGVCYSVGFPWRIIGLFWMRSTLVRIGLPSLLNSDAYFVVWITGAPWEHGRRTNCKTLFHPFLFFGLLVSRYLFL